MGKNETPPACEKPGPLRPPATAPDTQAIRLLASPCPGQRPMIARGRQIASSHPVSSGTQATAPPMTPPPASEKPFFPSTASRANVQQPWGRSSAKKTSTALDPCWPPILARRLLIIGRPSLPVACRSPMLGRPSPQPLVAAPRWLAAAHRPSPAVACRLPMVSRRSPAVGCRSPLVRRPSPIVASRCLSLADD